MKNKVMKRICCGFLSATLAMGLVSFTDSTAAYAKTPKTGKISVTVTQDYKMAQEILKYVNQYRKKNHRKTLKMDKDLTKAAITRGAETHIYTPQSSPHRRPNGKLTKTLNRRICYENCEQVGGSYYLTRDGYDDAKKIVNNWISSAPHRKGLLLPNAKSVGVGATYTTTDAGYINSITYTLEFSNTKAKKVEKSKGLKKYTKNVDTKTSYLKKTYFSLRSAYDYNTLNEHINSVKLYPRYNSPYMYATPTINPSTFSWSSSNPSIATVDKNGVVKRGTQTGKVTITAKLKTGNKASFSKILNVE